MKNAVKGILALIFFAIVGFTVFDWSSKEDVSETPFAQLKREDQKAEWLAKYQRRSDDAQMALNFQIENSIKGKFKFPDEVEFVSGTPIVSQARVKDTSKGVFVQQGEVIAKNALGVKSKYVWEAEFTLTDTEKEIKRIEVFNL